MKKILSWTVAGIVSIGGLAACGSDDDDKSPTTTAASEVTTGDTVASGDDTATTAAGTSSGSAAAEQFCTDVASLVANGPSDPDYAANLQKLSNDAVALATNATPEDSARIQECVTQLTPGG